MHCDFNEIDAKWQKRWKDAEVYKVSIDRSRPKLYVLDMFPYPSGTGLHVGHPLGYIASDIYARFKRMLGYNVLHPMGWDAFGLPAEQYAIQTGQHPAETTRVNIQRFRAQLDKMGLSFDWCRELSTADPRYYKWTQWTVVQLFEHWYDLSKKKTRPIAELVERLERAGTDGLDAACTKPLALTADSWRALDAREREAALQNYRLVYQSEALVNWCPTLGTVLANDEVSEGLSVRGNHPVEQRKMKQWALRVTAYADRLLTGLTTLEWSDAIVEIQRNWIGRSEGAQIFFRVDGREGSIEVFTTRPDTIFGATFLVLAPEHPLAASLATPERASEVADFCARARLTSERDRLTDVKRADGAFTGSYARHPLTGESIPIWLADYVIASYGTGAIMAVPGHDARDHNFAKQHGLRILEVVSGGDVSREAYEERSGHLVNSRFLDGLDVPAAMIMAIEAISTGGFGKSLVRYRLRDAVFSRQRYWGEPFPIFYEDGLPRALQTSALPLVLPTVDKYLPTESGDPPLARASSWQTLDGHPFDCNTMPGFAGSSAYSLRYMDPANDSTLVGAEAVDYWRDVDLYVGGREHATGHLIYARFWNMFLYDLGVTRSPEPFKKMLNQGMITGRSSLVYRVKGENRFISAGLKDRFDTVPIHVEIGLVSHDKLDIDAFRAWRAEFSSAEFVLEDGRYICGSAVEKMSKSLYNTVSPDDVIKDYGADTLRLYEMFLGPIVQSKPWQSDGIEGVHRFLYRLYALVVNEDGSSKALDRPPTEEEQRIIHRCIKKVREDYDSMAHNTAVSACMIALNALTKLKDGVSRDTLERFVLCLAPMAPHLCEELWERLGHEPFLLNQPFPEFEERFVLERTVQLPISINGKKRFLLEVPVDIDDSRAKELVLGDHRMRKLLDGKQPKKIIYLAGRTFNVVV